MKKAILLVAIGLAAILLGPPVSAQSTAFTYQGSLHVSGLPANGNYDFQFALFDAASGGSQLGTTIIQSNMPVTNSGFSVLLDFGDQFQGSARYLDVKVRQAGGGVYSTLSPRQVFTSTPYSIRSINSTLLNGVPSSGFISNSTTQQASSNFNISGNGTVGGTGTFVGNVGVGTSPPASTSAALHVISAQTGIINPSPANPPPSAIRGEVTSSNASTAGVTGVANSVNGLGVLGITNGSGGGGNNAVGVLGIAASSTGPTVGVSGIVSSPTGTAISAQSTTGSIFEGRSSTAGSGVKFQVSADGSIYSAGTAVIDGDTFTRAIYLSSLNGPFRVTTNGDVTAANINAATISVTTVNSTNGIISNQLSSGTLSTGTINTTGAVNIGGDASVAGTLNVGGLASGGNSQLCTLSTGANIIRFCSSSVRYKTDILPFGRGLDIVQKLKPITFRWKENGVSDIGLAAEDVANIEPLLTFENPEHKIEGIKYNQLVPVLVNAIKEQQTQLDLQTRQIDSQQSQIDSLRSLVCKRNRKAAVCNAR